MMNDTAINPLILETGWILIHFTWQAALLGIAHKLLLKRAEANAALRYRISLVALLLLVALPVLTALQLTPAGSSAGVSAAVVLPPADVTEVTRQATSNSPVAMPSLEARVMPWLVGAWLVGVMIYALRFLLGFIGLRRIIRKSSADSLPEWLFQELEELRQSLGISQRVRLATSTLIESPMVTGWLVPTILLPVCAATRLTPAQLRMTLLHELAHVQRHDYLVNLLQVVVETLFFFHPVAHQVSRSLRLEREKCCDDIVTRHCGNRLGYARLLTELETLRQPLAPEWSLGITAGAVPGELTSRVLRITGVTEHASAPRMNWPLLMPLLFIALLLGLRTTLPETDDRVRYSIALPVEKPASLPEPITASEGELREPQSHGEKSNYIPAVSASKTARLTKAGHKPYEPATTALTTEATAPTPQAAGSAAGNNGAATNSATNPAAEESLAENGSAIALAGMESSESAIITPAESNVASLEEEHEISGGRVLSVVPPEYPRYALQHGVVGKVTLGFTVETDGRTSNIKVIAAEPRRVFNDAAIEAVRQWRFEPFMMNGNAIAHEVRQTLDFSPGNGNADSGLRDCNTLTGSRLCRSDPVRGANVTRYTGNSTVGN